MRIRILIKKAKFLSLESVLVCAEHFRLDILQAFSATQNPAESFVNAGAVSRMWCTTKLYYLLYCKLRITYNQYCASLSLNLKT